MSKAGVWAVVVLIAVGCLLVPAIDGAGNENSAPAAGLPFKGQILVISSRSDPEMGAVLRDVAVARLGEDSFLVGTGVDDGRAGNWQRGRTVWISISDVSQIVEFDNVEQYMEAE